MLINNKINANWYWLLLTGRKKQYITASNCQMELSLTWYSVRFLVWVALISAVILLRWSGEWYCVTSWQFGCKETEPVSSNSELSSITSEWYSIFWMTHQYPLQNHFDQAGFTAASKNKQSSTRMTCGWYSTGKYYGMVEGKWKVLIEVHVGLLNQINMWWWKICF